LHQFRLYKDLFS